MELGEQPGSCWHFCVLELTQESGDQQRFHYMGQHAGLLPPAYTALMEPFPSISVHRYGSPETTLVSDSVPNIWTNPGNLGGRTLVLAPWGLKGS